MDDIADRSLHEISPADLDRLAEVAEDVESDLFARKPDGAGRYRGRLLCRVLAQGAAQHYLDGEHGVDDFDIWSFYAALDSGPFPPRWVGNADFGASRFGRSALDPDSYAGRRVDLFGRSLPAPSIEPVDPVSVVQSYLSEARSSTARMLAGNPIVLLTPEDARGSVIWRPEP